MTTEKKLDKIKGTIYGQAIGDALGLGTEGMTDEDMAWKYLMACIITQRSFRTGTESAGRLATGLMTPI